MTRGIQFDSSSIRIDGQNAYLNSGEFHYFRVPAKEWRHRMSLLKSTGANCLATYFPWSLHEPKEGEFRFDTGDGITDIRAFLDCAEKEKLLVIARPGPYQYSELINAGLPKWLCLNYKEALARNRRGEIFCTYAMSYLHPIFLEKTRAYFSQICSILAEYSVDRGGPLAMLQLDNEAGGIHVWMGDLDFNPETMGFGHENGRYAEFLKKRYSSIEQINCLYGTTHRTYSEFSPMNEPEKGTLRLRWNRDYFDFYTEYIAEYLDILRKMFENAGLNLPCCHNSPSPSMNSWFRESKMKMGNKILICSDHYYNLHQRWPQNNPTPQYAVNIFFSGEVLRMMGNPLFVMEFPTGTISDWPPISHVDMEAALILHAGIGIRGHNGYIFTGGPNPNGLGTVSEIYDYNAPVGAKGEIRPSYDMLLDYGRFRHMAPELNTDETDADYNVYVPWHILRAGTGWGSHDDKRVADSSQICDDMRRGLLTTSLVSGLMPQFVDISLGLPGKEKPLLVVCDGVMPKNIQQKIVEFLSEGGRILIWPVFPFLDENLCPFTLLSDFLYGASSGSGVETAKRQVCFDIAGINNIWSNSWYYPSVVIPDGAHILGREKVEGTVAAWRYNLENLGCIIFLGFSWFHAKNEHSDMLVKLMLEFNVRQCLKNENPWVMTFRRRTASGIIIFAANLSTTQQDTRLSLSKDLSKKEWDSGNINLRPMEVKAFFTYKSGY